MNYATKFKLGRCIGGLCLTLGLSQSANAGINDTPTPRIVSGTPAEPSAFPWIVSLEGAAFPPGPSSHMCGGTLIAPTWVMTAAHCVADIPDPKVLRVALGSTKLSAAQELINVVDIKFHSGYDPKTTENDIALVQLGKPATVAPLLDLLSPETHAVLANAGTSATIAGWGLTRFDSSSPVDDLRTAQVPIQSDQDCAAVLSGAGLPALGASVMCAGYEAGDVDACKGDSGGPLLVPDGGGYALAGIVSFGFGCAKRESPTFYTRVASFRDWISGCMAGDPSCASDRQFFKCGDGQIIPPTWKCDGWADCDDGSDEGAICPNTCQVPPWKRCDGYADCADGSDEDSCTTCAVDPEQICDGVVDCGDSSDELHCGCTKNAADKWECPACTADSVRLCDRHVDCPGATDEENCCQFGDRASTCQSCQFAPSERCNGLIYCFDQSDEKNCEEDRTPSIVRIFDEPPGKNCKSGGLRIVVAQDVNVNGEIDKDEIRSKKYVCSEAAPDSGRSPQLVRVSDEAPGSHCAAGGQRVEAGADRNGSGKLDDDEVVSATYVCNEGAASLVEVQEEPPGERCKNGGQLILRGPDTDGNGALDKEEIVERTAICNGDIGSRGDGCSVHRPGNIEGSHSTTLFLFATLGLLGRARWARRRSPHCRIVSPYRAA